MSREMTRCQIELGERVKTLQVDVKTSYPRYPDRPDTVKRINWSNNSHIREFIATASTILTQGGVLTLTPVGDEVLCDFCKRAKATHAIERVKTGRVWVSCGDCAEVNGLRQAPYTCTPLKIVQEEGGPK